MTSLQPSSWLSPLPGRDSDDWNGTSGAREHFIQGDWSP